MTWQYQVRFDLNDAATAESARRDLRHPLLAPLEQTGQRVLRTEYCEISII